MAYSTGIPKPRTASFSLHISPSTGLTSTGSSTPSPTNLGRVPLDARVVLSRRRSGYVRYIGKLKNESGEWYGIALDEAKGDHDGAWHGERLFTCAPSHGIYVRRKEIFYVKEQANNVKSPPSPVMNDSCDGSTGTSNSSHTSADDLGCGGSGGEAAAVTSSPSKLVSPRSPSPSLSPARLTPATRTTTAAAAISPLQRTFKSVRRVLQSPMKLGETVANVISSSQLSYQLSPTSPSPATKNKTSEPSLVSPTTTKRTSMIPPPAIAKLTNANTNATRHQSIASHHAPLTSPLRSPTPSPLASESSKDVAPLAPVFAPRVHQLPQYAQEMATPSLSSSIFEEDHGFASMTRALAEQNNPTTTSCTGSGTGVVGNTTLPAMPPLPPQIDEHHDYQQQQQQQPQYEQPSHNSSTDGSPSTTSPPSPFPSPSSQLRRPSADRRHSTFAFGSPLVPSSAATSTANAVRVVELEKEIVTMRTNHENVVAVLRATNKQHAANVLELRTQVSGLADGNNWLQKQLSSKSAQLAELKQSERSMDLEKSELHSELQARSTKIQTLEQEITILKDQLQSVYSDRTSVLVELQKEFQAKQQRDKFQIRQLREQVVALNARHSSMSSKTRKK